MLQWSLVFIYRGFTFQANRTINKTWIIKDKYTITTRALRGGIQSSLQVTLFVTAKWIND